MDRLSPEIICMIFDYLVYTDSAYNDAAYNRLYGLRTRRMCSTLAVVSRKWQHIIERDHFRHIRLRGTIDEISQFGAIYSQPRRQGILQRLDLLAAHKCSCEHLSHEFCKHRQNALMGALYALFQTMEGWEPRSPSLAPGPSGILLVLATGHSSEDKRLRDSSLFKEDCPHVWKSTKAMENITSLSAGWSVNYLTTYRLPALFSNLQTLKLDLLPATHGVGGHQYLVRVRKALIRALRDARTGLPHLRNLTIGMGTVEPRNHQFDFPDLRDEEGVDELCEAIRLLSLAVPLRQLYLDMVQLSLDLFQDCRLTDSEKPDSTSWPLLEDFRAWFPPVAPSGMWYTKGNPKTYTGPYGSRPLSEAELETRRNDYWNPMTSFQYRNTIDPVRFNPLQAAFARAILRMPALRFGSLSMIFISTRNALGVGMMDRSMVHDITERYDDESPDGIEHDKETDGVLNRNERVVRVEGVIEGRTICESMSRSERWNRKTMFCERPAWVPTPEIAELWMEWTMGI